MTKTLGGHAAGSRHRGLTAFTVLLLLGFFFRTFRLAGVPSGLTWDEGAEGLETAALFQGRFPVFFPEHGGHEPLLVYLQAAALKLLGWNSFSLRLPTAFLSTLALAATFLLARRLFGWRTAWLATLLQAVALWQVIMSRLAIRPATLILFGTLAIYWLVRWLWGSGGPRSAAICGLCLGLATYTYTAGRFLALVVALMWLATLLRSPKKRWLIGEGATAGGVAAVVFAPLGWYFVSHAGTFSERAGELSIFNPAYGPPLLNWLNGIKAAALMFSFAGEPGWDKNIAHQPMFDPAVSILLVLGLALALWRWRRPNHLLALVWLAVTILPLTLTAKDLPDWGRVSGVAPAVFFFPALVAAAAWRRWPPVGLLLGIGAVALAGVTYWQYFVLWEGSPGRAESYRPSVLDVGQAAVGRLLAPRPPALVYFGAPDQYDAVAGFLALGLGVQRPDLAPRLVEYDASLTQVLPPAGFESYILTRGPEAVTALPPLASTSSATFEDALQLQGYDLPLRAAPGSTVTFHTQWRPLRAGGPPVTLFAHLVDYSGEQAVASLDQNGFPARAWHGGETVQSSFPLAVPETAPAGAYWLEFGAYTDDGRRLHTTAGQDALRLGPLVVVSASPATAPPVAQLGSQVALLPPMVSRTADGADVELRLLPLRPFDQDYSIFVHVLDASGKLVAQADGPPTGGRWPSRYWLPNVIVDDRRHVVLPPGLPAGQYQLTAGLYRLDTGERLPAAPTGPEPGSAGIGEVAVGR